MAVRRFTRTSGDNIDFGPVDLTGAFTIALVVKRMSNGVWHSLIEGLTSANAVAWAIELDNVGDVSMESGGVAVIAGSVLAADGWVIIVVSKPAGTTGISLDLYKGSWAARATIGTGSPNPPSQAGGSIKFGRYGVVSGDDADVEIATAAIWNGTQLTQAQAQALSSGSASAWDGNAAGAPTEHWEFNQAAVTTSITGRKGVSSQTARSGTTVVTGDDPASSVYSFAAASQGGPATASVRFGTIPAGVKTGKAAATATVRATTSSAGGRFFGAAASALARFATQVAGGRVVGGGSTATIRLASQTTGIKRGISAVTSLIRFATQAQGSAAAPPSASGPASALLRLATTSQGRKTGRASVQSTLDLSTASAGIKNAIGAHDEVGPIPPFTTQVVGALARGRLVTTAAGVAAIFQGGPAQAFLRLTAAVTGRKSASGIASATDRFTPAVTGRKTGAGTASTLGRFLTAATGVGQGAAAGPASALIRLATSAAGSKNGRSAATATTVTSTASTGRKTVVAASSSTVRLVTQAAGTGGSVRGGAASVTIRFAGVAAGRKATTGAANAAGRFLTAAAGARAASGGALTAVRFTVTASGITGVIEPKQWPVSSPGYVLAGDAGYVE